ncbi:MAG: chlorohydrolase [Candidatus Poribacteria bacterium]|nr:MAG: chlorohydrolase [Candidatus Poribacteria bacterium]
MILRAKYVMPSSHEVFENGAVRIQGGLIAEVGRMGDVEIGGGERVLDLGEVALLPGFINAHTHLELGHLAGQIPPPKSFADWLETIVHRRETDPIRIAHLVEAGVRQALASGTTTIADVTYTGATLEPLCRLPIRKRVHLEAIGFDPRRADSVLAELDQKITSAPEDPLLTVGLSPHAPYSTSERLYQLCIEYARERRLPMCSHVAETPEEEEFVARGTGPLLRLLDRLGVLHDHWRPRGETPVQYLDRLGFWRQSPLLIHGNYIRDEDIPILRDQNVTVVYCPRSHDYFGHPDHPFEKLFARGINVALGTDSLASTPDLSLLNEMRFLTRRYPHVSPERILTLAMLNGAKSIRVRAKVGGLRAGWNADLVAVALPPGSGRIAERILAEESQVVLTMVEGRVAYQAERGFLRAGEGL